jgi:hypothetical protein
MNKYDCGETYDYGIESDEWETMSKQLDYWADLDKEYWRQRRENEYRRFLERKYGVVAQ